MVGGVSGPYLSGLSVPGAVRSAVQQCSYSAVRKR